MLSKTYFATVEQALAACELAGYEPRSHVTGLGEQTYWVHLPGFVQGFCYWGDAQFLDWANGHWRLLEIEKIRHQAGWEELQEEDSPAGLHGWHAPCGTHEDAWRELGRPMPEDAESTVFVAAGRTEVVCPVPPFVARAESKIPTAYRLIRRGDGNGSMVPMLQGLFAWTEGTKRGAEWRDLKTQDEPYIEDAIPLGLIN